MAVTHHHHHPSPRGDHDHQGTGPAQDDGQAQILDLDAEVMAEHTAGLTAWLPVQAPPAELLDLGAGTGTGTFALLHQFPDAHVTAVDSSAAHLEMLQARVVAADLADRVRIVLADLDAPGWPDLGTPDLVWASASMHHLADPDRALRTICDLLAPDGLVAVVELAGLPRFLPPAAPADRPGLEERCHAATEPFHAEHLPHRGADWGPKLAAAGFALEDPLVVTVDIPSSDTNAVGAYALATLQRIRGVAADRLAADDLAALDRLLDTTGSHSILRRVDLAVRSSRTVWVARPAAAREGHV